jgi:hypothetical protein
MKKRILLILILGVMVSMSGLLFAQVDFEYLGCYKDNRTRDLNGAESNSQRMTIHTCIKECKTRGFEYAGVQYGNQCFCGN